MMKQYLVSVMGPDQRNFLHKLSEQTLALNGRWISNKVCHFEGRMAAIFKLEIAEDAVAKFEAVLQRFEHITYDIAPISPKEDNHPIEVHMHIEGEDRNGLTTEITEKLKDYDVHIGHFESQRLPVVGVSNGVYTAQITAFLPNSIDPEELKSDLEGLHSKFRVEYQ
ncbi:glycine cleavage system protein R [Salinibius halmophilus]|uniref:glycine cleavage system protein R n=1 Tax=Salinibius halmophilus TaxID=1853216 RepID=UPI0013145156|nr:ACT domain-containing protein [Salinibius halmophilus]